MIRIGIIGTGGISRTHVAMLEQRPDQARITAVVDLAPENAQWLVDKTGAKFYANVAEALGDIDAAIVTTPPRSRVDVIRTLAEAGKAILCEKPLAGTVEDARAIADIVNTTGIPFMVGFMRRWHPPYAELRALARSEELGRPLQFYRRRMGILEQQAGNWRVSSNQLTGFTIESVSHDIDLLRWIGGDIVEARGEVIESRSDLPGYDDMVVATLRFANGAVGILQIAWSAHIFENAVGVYGTEKAAVIDGEGFWSSDRLRIKSKSDAKTTETTFAEADASEFGYGGQMDTFLALAYGENVDHPGVADGVASIEISSQILASSSGR